MPHPIVCYASERQYLDHLRNIARHLPEALRVVHADVAGYASQDPDWADALVVRTAADVPNGQRSVWVVMSTKDGRFVPPGAALVSACHGAGNVYDNPAFLTRADGRARLVLTPNESSVAPLQRYNPRSRVVAVGSPQLDTWPELTMRPGRKTVALSFHWDAHTVPETRTALPHYIDAIRDLGARQHALPFDLIGHGHPRAWADLEALYTSCGIEAVRDYETGVVPRADLYVCDSSSTLYSFAATGKPVLVLNAPWYRRGVHQGLRFWDGIPGFQCDEPEDLGAAILRALEDPSEAQRLRAEGVRMAYGELDRRAGERAAALIRELADDPHLFERNRTVALPSRPSALAQPIPQPRTFGHTPVVS